MVAKVNKVVTGNVMHTIQMEVATKATVVTDKTLVAILMAVAIPMAEETPTVAVTHTVEEPVLTVEPPGKTADLREATVVVVEPTLTIGQSSSAVSHSIQRNTKSQTCLKRKDQTLQESECFKIRRASSREPPSQSLAMQMKHRVHANWMDRILETEE